MKKQKYIVGNWKMNPATPEEARTIFSGIARGAAKTKKVTTILCPSILHFSLLAEKSKKTSVKLGVQNFFTEEKGSYTGEISIDMVRNAGAQYAIIGHSERRKFNETNEIVNKKVLLALKNKITPIICIGEAVRDEEGKYYLFIKEQIEKSLAGVPSSALSKIMIAYEPIWAIGAAAAMDPHDVHVMSIFIKRTLVDIYKLRNTVSVPILYGGSVDPTNAHGILTSGGTDGLLIGRQSLVPKSFLEIIDIAHNS